MKKQFRYYFMALLNLFVFWLKSTFSIGGFGLALVKVKYGEMISDMRGKINGTVHSKNKYGSYMRNKVTPVNRNTNSQSAQRTVFAQVSQNWRSLTEAQRNTWITRAPQFTAINIFGDNTPLSGSSLHQKINLYLYSIGEAFITDCPLPTDIPGFTETSFSFVNATGIANVTYSPAIDASVKVLVSATPALSAGKNFVKSEYRYVKTLDSTNLTPNDIGTAWRNVFGANPPVGSKVFVSIVPINIATGLPGVPINSVAIVS